jgi:hypothetical protein
MELKSKFVCPHCGKECKDWGKFRYHVLHFNHSRGLERTERDSKVVAAYQSGRYLSVSSLARHFRLQSWEARNILKRKGVLKHVRKSKLKDVSVEVSNSSSVSGGSGLSDGKLPTMGSGPERLRTEDIKSLVNGEVR